MNNSSPTLKQNKRELKLTVLGHSCLYIEMGNIRLLTDPWLIGSCYWRSWWNYPEVDKKLLYSLSPTHIYITHLHWDHYHGPTLRYFEKNNPKILLPKSCTKRMINDMKKFFKFTDIRELTHGKEYILANDFKITSYQFNPIIIDSALSIEASGIKILNANDSKTFGLSLKQITSKYRYFDFVFRSHSSATQIPHCINKNEEFGFQRSPLEYTKEFLAFSSKVNAKYAVPFASSHIYLHKDSIKFNYLYNSPLKVLQEAEKRNFSDSIIKLMPSGSVWSSKTGFNIREHFYEDIDKHILDYKEKYKDNLESQYQIEANSKPNIKSFNNYYKKFFNALKFVPSDIRFGFVFTNREMKSNNEFAIVDMKKYKSFVEKDKFKPPQINLIMEKYELDFILETTVKIFNDCNTKEMYNCWGPSKLLKIHLRNKKKIKKYTLFCKLIDLYENDGLPVWNFFTKRQLFIRLRRWREIFDIISFFILINIRKKPIEKLWN